MNITLIAKDSTRIVFLDNSVVASGETYSYIDVSAFDVKTENEKVLVTMIIHGISYFAESEVSLLYDLSKIKEKVEASHVNVTSEDQHLAHSIAMSNDVRAMKKDLNFIKTVVLIFVILFGLSIIGTLTILGSAASSVSSTPSYNTDQYGSDDYA